MRSILITTLAASACIASVPTPPATGYGPPYRGTGEGIYVKDSRGDWAITEGQAPLTSEQALEASGDPEYAARHEAARAYNERVYREGVAHMERGNWMIRGGVIAAFGGGALEATSGSGSTGASLGLGLILVGLVTAAYGYYGGKQPPPYHDWHTPPSLDRPAYVRQQTELYNERIGAPLIPAMPQLDGARPAAGHLPAMRGTP